ncbi:MAG: hypothetical protein IPH06_05275 [Alphaproteobacteria bacterium]|jgi:hypothetical protein|nr:hypothetical protein [Alphaproteobacteria bacterium]QQS57433.1 MAG: hypothetical protein IPN28_01040 [Alphaproteobacteria bacterium]
MKMAKKQNHPLTSNATVVDGKLILSLPDACSPVVWQMDFEEYRSSALEVREDLKNNRFTLCLKNQKNEAIDIACYEDRHSAVNALMAASQALETGHGKIRPQLIHGSNNNHSYIASGSNGIGTPNSSQMSNSGNSKAGVVLAGLMIIILVLAWTLSIPKSSDMMIRSAKISPGSNSETGVAQSADDFLSRRQ